MKPENGGFLLLAILILSGLQAAATPAGNTSGPVNPPKAPQIKQTDQKPDDACYRSFERLLNEYTIHNPTASQPGDQGPKLEFLVATVPDPIDSQMGWHFDLQLDAVQRAIEGSGYVVDRYSLPWSCISMEAIKGNFGHRIYEENPGVVIFRSKDESDPRLLTLFLVGETPTAGIHKRAFEIALSSIKNRWMQEKRPPDAPARALRLLGPTFSGSVKSLKGIIDVWWKECASKDRSIEFRIMSGSASNANNKRELERAVDGVSFVRFEATVIPDNVLIDRLVDYFNGLGVDHHKVAVLTESNTGYGSGLQKDISSDSAKPAAVHETGNCGAGCWLSIPFPMHISKTRSAYEKSLPLKDQYNELLGKAGDPERTVLPLSLDESGNPRDVLPVLASTTPLYDELALSSTLSTISRSGFRYIGLLATDTKDKLFLARQVRKYCPDVRLFTLESDMLYSHPTYSFFMEGAIVVSTYSLFNKNQVWSLTSDGRQKRLQFPNNGAQGVYNATLALLNRKAEMIEYATPFKRYEADSVTRPSVWISTVGRDGLWPLRFYGDYDAQGYVSEGVASAGGKADEAMSRRMHLGFTPFLLVLLSIYSLACCFGYLRVYRRPPDCQLPPGLRVLDLFRPRLSARRRRSQNRHLFVFFLALTLLYTWLGTLFLIPRAFDIKAGLRIHFWEQLYIAGMLYSALVLASTTLIVSFKVVSCEKRFIRLLLLKGARVRRALKRLSVGRKKAKRGRAIAGLLNIPPVTKGKTAWGKSRPVRVTTTAVGLVAVYALTFLFAVPYLSSMVETVLLVCRQPGRTFSRPVQAETSSSGPDRAARAGLLSISMSGERRETESGVGKDEPLIIDTAMLLSERARNAANGVSPVFPVLALAAGLCLWSLCTLRRLRLAETVTTASPFARGGLASAGVTRLETQVRQTLENSFKSMPRGVLPLVLIVLTGIPCFVISMRFISTFEGPVFDHVFLGAFFLMHAAIALTFFQFISLWHRMKQLLRRLALHPTVGAYDRLPSRLSRQVGEQFWAGSPTVADQVFSVQQWLLLCAHFNARIKHQAKSQLNIPEGTIKRLEELMRDAQTQTMREGFADELGEHSLENISRGKTQRTLSSAAGALVEMLEHYWKSRGLSGARADAEPLKADSIPASKPTTDLFKRDMLDAVDIWFRLAEEFIAIQVVTFINQVFVHLRALLTFITAGSLLMLLTITYYPFQPQRLMTLFIWSCILSIVLASLIVFIQASRNEVMSRIGGTAANRVTFDRTFISMVVTYGVLPLFGLLIMEFPQMLRFFSWIEPALRAFK